MSSSIQFIRKQMRERQIARIVAMEAGRELDALVAKYVMGLQVEKWRAMPDDPIDYWYRSQSGINAEDEEVERVPNYSTVIFSAEKIISKFKYWTISSDSVGAAGGMVGGALAGDTMAGGAGTVDSGGTEAGSVSVLGIDAKAHTHGVADGSGITADFSVNTEPGTKVTGCKTLAEAICKAALIAIVEENKIIEQLLVD